MMKYITPEQAGISSKAVQRYVEYLEKQQFSTHDLIFMKGNDIFFEKYWEPFHKDFQHRMYSVSKSFVSLAVGFAQQDGLLKLDDPISKYFPEEMKDQPDIHTHRQTIRDMLMMSTARSQVNWFTERTEDRVRLYFEKSVGSSRPAGMIFEYDSTGSFVLGALVERLTGKPFMDYLREKLFDKIGVSKEAKCLKCPGEHSWGDSAVICKATDLLKVARFVMNQGRWNGEQILEEAYLLEATSKQIDNNSMGVNTYKSQGYGYLFWRTYQDSYLFYGMGCQFALCVPEKDLIMVYNADNQGKDLSNEQIIAGFFTMIADEMQETALPENPEAYQELQSVTSDLKLMTAIGKTENPFAEKIHGVTYQMSENPMGITKMKITFQEQEGKLEYSNAQGDKTLYFGIGKNVFAKFPQEGYSRNYGSVSEKGNYYDCAASAAWLEPAKLFLKVQIIDEYFGNLNITLSYKEDRLTVLMQKSAEDFLNEYEGFAEGEKIEAV